MFQHLPPGRFSLQIPSRRGFTATTILTILALAQLAPAQDPTTLPATRPASRAAPAPVSTEIPFVTHDDHAMSGRLTLPAAAGPHPVVVYVQTAEGMTIDMKRPKGQGATFNYFDLYAEKLPALDVGFFRYEGRGIRTGDKPPRYEKIERETYDTSTLENKVRDVLSAVAVLAQQPGVDRERIFLMGASEGTLVAAEAASRAKKEIAGLVLYGSMSGTMRDLFRYIMTDGGFLTYRGFFDTDQDGRITREEFEADPRGYRKQVFRNAPFTAMDRDQDGAFTAKDMPFLTKVYLDAIAADDYRVLDNWARTSAGVSTPKGWFEDHFTHQPIWTFLAELDIPVGFFHGEDDAATSIAGVRGLEELARKAGKTRMQFHYFAGLEHTLGIGSYFTTGKLPAGHQAIFAFIEAETRKR